jgi:hypothetical protein
MQQQTRLGSRHHTSDDSGGKGPSVNVNDDADIDKEHGAPTREDSLSASLRSEHETEHGHDQRGQRSRNDGQSNKQGDPYYYTW